VTVTAELESVTLSRSSSTSTSTAAGTAAATRAAQSGLVLSSAAVGVLAGFGALAAVSVAVTLGIVLLKRRRRLHTKEEM
jgi:NAD/NADP transhydrogenase alpha subunit